MKCEKTISENSPDSYYSQLADLAINIGKSLLNNGAEIYRVEECMRRIINVYCNVGGEVFTIPSCIIVSIEDSNGHTITRIMRNYSIQTNLDRVRLLNELSRNICINKPTFDVIYNELDKISNSPIYHNWQKIVACGFVSTGFAGFFAGGFFDCVVAFICGCAIRYGLIVMGKLMINPFFSHLICSFIASVIALTASEFIQFVNSDIVIIAAFMNLVPGVAVTNFMRDIIAGDLISGITKLSEALLFSAAIAVGAATGIFMFSFM